MKKVKNEEKEYSIEDLDFDDINIENIDLEKFGIELVSLGIPTYYDKREFKRPGIREFIFDFFGIDLGLNIPDKYKKKRW